VFHATFIAGNRPARRLSRRPLDLPKRAPRRRSPRQGSAAIAGRDVRGELSHDSGPVPCQAGTDFGIDGRALLCPPFPYPGRRFIRLRSEKVLQPPACSPVFFCDALGKGSEDPMFCDLSCFCLWLCVIWLRLRGSPPRGLYGQRVCSHWVRWTCGHLVWACFCGGVRGRGRFLVHSHGRSEFHPLPWLTDPA
jgi:hypothetical protein